MTKAKKTTFKKKSGKTIGRSRSRLNESQTRILTRFGQRNGDMTKGRQQDILETLQEVK